MFTPIQQAHFNDWANRRIYSCCEKLSEEQLELNRNAFFNSIAGTLNHLLLVDILYMDRLKGQPSRFKKLNERVGHSFKEIKTLQVTQDAEYVNYFSNFEIDNLEKEICFKTLLANSELWRVPMRIYLANLFQHQVHHRGQIHNLLSQANLDPPPIGFVEFAIEHQLIPSPIIS